MISNKISFISILSPNYLHDIFRVFAVDSRRSKVLLFKNNKEE